MTLPRRPALMGLLLVLASALLPSCQAGDSSLALRSLHRERSGEGWRLSLDYPRFHSLLSGGRVGRALDREIDSFMGRTISDFLKESEANHRARAATADGTATDEGASGPDPVHEYVLRWRPVLLGPREVSLLLEAYSWTGGANGRSLLHTVNYELAGNRPLGPGELFGLPEEAWLPLVSRLCREELGRELGPQGSGLLEEGTAPRAGNFSLFTFDETGLTFHFPKYQVAPGSYGNLAVRLPRTLVTEP